MASTHLQSLPNVSAFFAGEPAAEFTSSEAIIDYEALFQQTPRSLILFDPQGRVITANPAYHAFWGHPVDQLPPGQSILPDAQLEAIGTAALFDRVLAGEIIQLPPLQHDVGSRAAKTADMRWFVGVLFPVHSRDGALQCIALLRTDVTKQIEDQLTSGAQAAQQAQRMREMLASTTDCVMQVDREWNYTFLNQRALGLISKGRTLVGMNLWDAFPDAAELAFGTQFHTAMEEQISVDFDEYYPEPVNMWLHVSAFPNAEGLAIFFQDTTERRKVEKQLRTNEKLVIVGRLAASIAHEINNPLESVTNLLYLLETEPGLPEDARPHIAMAQQEVHRIADIATNTLKFFKQTTQPAATSMKETYASVLTLYQGRIRHSGIAILPTFQAHAPYVCFAAEMRQIMANFLGNALDATRPGGRIHFRIRPGTSGRDAEAGVLITIADTGSGIDPQTVQHIYDAFFTTKSTAGTGLGLWVCMELIKKHGGHVKVRSRIALHGRSGGSVFRIFLPYSNGLGFAM